MSAKTKLIVLRRREVVYTACFLVLAVLLVILLLLMFGPKKQKKEAATTTAQTSSLYTPGVYTSTIQLGDQSFDVQVTVEKDRIAAISLNNVSETAEAMYPLMEPALDSLASQIYTTQSTEDLVFEEEQKYTSRLLLSAINEALEKAKKS